MKPSVSTLPPLSDYAFKFALGLFFILFTLLGVLNQAFLSGIISMLFGLLLGQLRLLGFLSLISYGFSLMANRPLLKIKRKSTLLGIVIMLIALLGLLTFYEYNPLFPETPLLLSNVWDIYFNNFPPLFVFPIDYSQTLLGGGMIGFVFIASLQSLGLSPLIGLLLYGLFGFGLLLALQPLWLYFFATWLQAIEVKQKEKAHLKKLTPKQDINSIFNDNQDSNK
jgi:hypothetical protein